MAKRPISDLARALDTVDLLEQTIARHDALLDAILTRIEAIEQRVGQSGAPPISRQ